MQRFGWFALTAFLIFSAAFALAGATAARAQDFEKQKTWCLNNEADADLRIGANLPCQNAGRFRSIYVTLAGGAPIAASYPKKI